MWVPVGEPLACRSPTPASLQQEQHLRSYLRGQDDGVPLSRLVYVTWMEPGQCDIDAMTGAINAHLNRHDTYRSRFVITDQACERFVLPDGMLPDFSPLNIGLMDAPAIRAAVAEVPGSTKWDCFRFYVVQHDDAFTVCAAIDHLHCDGLVMAPVFTDIHGSYARRAASAPARRHFDFCDDQAARVGRLTNSSPEVLSWSTFFSASGGTSVAMPGLDCASERLCELTVHRLMDGVASRDFERQCGRLGVRVIGAFIGLVGISWNELSGASRFRCVSPTSLQAIADVANSLGWQTGLVPVSFPTTGSSVPDTLRAAQRSFDAGRDIEWIPPEAAARLMPVDSPVASSDWSIPVVSLMDYTRPPYNDVAIGECLARDGRLMLNDGAAQQPLFWFCRDDEGVTLTVSAPSGLAAEKWVRALVHRVRALCHMPWSEVAS